MENQAINQPTAQTVRRQDDDVIDLVELFYVMWGHAWQIILCLVAGAAIAFGVTRFLITPMYQATSSIYIVSASNNSVVDLTDLQIGAQLTADYQELLVSRPLLEDVIKNLDLDLTTNDLAGMVSITNTADTRILKITVTSPDPRESADIANELVDQACIYLPQIMETDEPNLVEEAIPPTSKSSPSYSKNIVLGGLLGVILCCGVLVLRYLMNDTFMTPDDVARYLGVQPLATIPEADLGNFGQDKKRGLLKRKEAK
ncbi:Wzz/FepE/Etk N-terminal domain-containing protein [Faecalibacterium sp. An192]|uniref:YveK family protein n=1 Tax=Faecalibacterium sp. An192 TaxID=1965581 RepID=UPI0013027A06|nr:Wzz/FepE/Etk N-terminal domain-containing protein [Faecalibacterium sp. An192]